MVRIGLMADRISQLHRRGLLTGLAAAALSPALAVIAAAQSRPSLMLTAEPGAIALRQRGPDTPVWSLTTPSAANLRFKRQDLLEVTLENRLPVPVAMNWPASTRIPIRD